MIELENDIFFSSHNEDMDLDTIFNFVKKSYWGRSRTIEEQQIAMDNSINFGLFFNGNQIAYTRVMTDKVFFAYVLDFFVLENFQGKGCSQYRYIRWGGNGFID